MNQRSAGSWSDSVYWDQSRRPLACLLFLLPLLLAYEAGVVWLNGGSTPAFRNLADAWMRHGLTRIGLDHAMLLPVLVMGGLLAWHLGLRHPWRVQPATLAGMFGESVLFATGLLCLAHLQWWAFGEWGLTVSLSPAERLAAGRLIGFVGAGVYEEVLFRLCLLPACWMLLMALGIDRRPAAVAAVVASSLLFALAHYTGGSGEAIGWFSFSFRALAGGVFAGLFLWRGFGITVGAHAAYDILVGLLLTAG